MLPNSQRSIDMAPLPLTMTIKSSERSTTRYSIPSPFFSPNQFIVHPSGKCTIERLADLLPEHYVFVVQLIFQTLDLFKRLLQVGAR